MKRDKHAEVNDGKEVAYDDKAVIEPMVFDGPVDASGDLSHIINRIQHDEN